MIFCDLFDFPTSYNTARVLLISNREAFQKICFDFHKKTGVPTIITIYFCQHKRTLVERSIFSFSVMLPFFFSGLQQILMT